MPYLLNVPPAAAAGFDELAAVLRRPRDLAVDVPARHGDWEPTPGSQAERDLADRIFPEDVNRYLLHHPRAVASLYILSGSHYLAGIAALVRGREVMLSPGALARAAFEHGVRALLVLDPRETTRVRSVRAMLDDLVSRYQVRLTLKHLVGKAGASYQDADRRWAAARAVAERSFSDVHLADDPHKWLLEGQRYPRMNAAAESWSQWRAQHIPSGASTVQAEGFYDALCLYTHPQSFPSHPDAVYGPDVDSARLETDPETVAKLALGAHAAVMDAAGVLYHYHGWDVPELAEIADAANAVPTGA